MEHLPLYNFIDSLKAHGFNVSAAQHLRVRVLLDKIDPSQYSFDDLKTLLCPIFAQNAQQQALFYNLLEAYWPNTRNSINTAEEATIKFLSHPKSFQGKLPWIIVVSGALMLFIIFALMRGDYYTTAPPVDEAPKTGQTASVDTSTVDRPPIQQTPIPTPVDTSVVSASETVEQQQTENSLATLIRNQKQLFLYAGLALLLLSYIGLEIYLRWRQKLIARREAGKRPPYTWQINIDDTPEVVYENDFDAAANLLRRRQVNDAYVLDIPKTIHETAVKGGYADLQYKPMTSPSEYLVLIDRSSIHNHQSRLFEVIVRSLSQSDIFIEEYFFQRDPRVCWKTLEEEHIYLRDLQLRYPNHRLLIFGNGEGLLNPVSGDVDAVLIELLGRWKQRALLTGKPGGKWGFEELLLAEQFTVLPANFDGLINLVEHFETVKPSDLRYWKYQVGETDVSLEGEPPEVIGRLRQGLHKAIEESDTQNKDALFEWVCACAVYPQLFWDLTLHLGKEVFPDDNLLTPENLSLLTRLQWFREGFIPPEMRWELIKQLPNETLQTTRRAIVELMKLNPPDPQSYAFDEYRINLVFYELLLNEKTKNAQKRLKKELKKLYENSFNVDFTIAEFLRKKQSEVIKNVEGFNTGNQMVKIYFLGLILFLFPPLWIFLPFYFIFVYKKRKQINQEILYRFQRAMNDVNTVGKKQENSVTYIKINRA